MRPTFRSTIAVLALCAATLAACGSDNGGGDARLPGALGDDTSDAVGDDGGDPDGNDGGWSDPDLDGTGEAGTVTVDGVSYAIDSTRQCDPTGHEFHENEERELWLEGVGLADEVGFEETRIEVSTGEQPAQGRAAERQVHTIGWDGPEGLYSAEGLTPPGGGELWTSGTNTLDGPPLELTDDRVTGGLTLRSHLGSPPVEVTVDLDLASDVADCS